VEFQLTAWLEQEPGVLDRALAAFTRRRVRIGNLVADVDPASGLMRCCVRFRVDSPEDAHRLAHQVARGVQVWAVTVEPLTDAVAREVVLARVRCERSRRPDLLALAASFGGTAVAVSDEYVVLAVSAESERITGFLQALAAEWGLESATRAGVAMPPAPTGPLVPGLPAFPRHPLYPDHEEVTHSWQPFTMTATPIRPSSGSAR
jgi:acetolactate synthase small subunit